MRNLRPEILDRGIVNRERPSRNLAFTDAFDVRYVDVDGLIGFVHATHTSGVVWVRRAFSVPVYL